MAIHTSDKLIEELRTYHLLSSSQLSELDALPSRPADPKELAKEIVKRDWLTRWQVNTVYRGRTKDLFLEPYVLLDKLGEGGMGQVYKARHQRLERIVALKVIKTEKLTSKDAVARFQREARAAAQLSHANIVTLFEDGQEGDTHWFAMEFVRGVDLSRWVREKGPMPLAPACNFIRQAASGLQHAHERGMVHRDIKPSNLMLVAGTTQVKVLDMGLARLDRGDDDGTDSGSLTQEGAVMGTPDFLAPEQAMNAHKVDIRADIYSLGCSLYFLLTGQPPFPGGSLSEKLLKHQLQMPKSVREIRPEVPEALAGVLDRSMAKKPEERYLTPGELAAALTPFCKPGALSAVQMPTPPAVNRVMASDTDTPHPSPTVVPGDFDVEVLTDMKPAIVTKPASVNKPNSVNRARANAASRSNAWIGWVLGGVTGIGALLAAALLLVVFLNFLGGDRPPEPPVIEPPPPKQLVTLDALSAGAIPQQELFAWQPKELVAVFSTHKWRHWGPVKALAYNAANQEFASFGDDDMVRLCDASTGVERLALSTQSGNPATALRALAISPNGRYIAVMVDNKIAVHLTTTGREEAVNLPGSAMAFSPDNKVLAVANGLAVDLYNVADGFAKDKVQLPSKGGPVTTPVFSPKDNLLAAVTAVGKKADIKIWDYTKGDLKTSIPLDFHHSRTLVFTPDGKQVITGAVVNEKNTWPVMVWDVASKKAVGRMDGHQAPVWSMALSRDGQTLATAGLDGTVRIWEVDKFRERIALREHEGAVEAVALSADDTTLASGGRDGSIHLYDVAAGKEREASRIAHASWIKAAALSIDRAVLATSELQPDHGVRLWDAGTVKERAWLKGHRKPVLALSFSHDNQVLATGSLDKTVGLWDVAKAAELKPLVTHAVYAVAFAPEGRTLALGSDAPSVKIVDTATSPPKELANLPGHTKKVVALDWYRDGKKLVSAGDDGTLRAWDAVKGKELFALPAHAAGVNAVAVSPKGKLIVSAGPDGLVKVWDPTLVKNWPPTKEQSAAALQMFAPLGRYARPPEVQPVHAWKNPLTYGPGPAAYRALAFTTDGKTLAVGCARGSLTLYDTATWKVQQQWKLPGAVQEVTFDVYGRHLICTNGNGTVYVLRLAAK